MNRFLTLSFALGLSVTALAAGATKEHLVERGETLESIAQNYGLSVAQILELNPSAKDFFYAGMVLELPENSAIGTNVAQETQNNESNTNYYTAENSRVNKDNTNQNRLKSEIQSADSAMLQPTENQNENEEKGLFEKGKTYYGFDIAYLFPKGGANFATGDYNTGLSVGYNFSMEYTIKAGHYFLNNLYAQGGLGFGLMENSIQTSIRGQGDREKYETTTYYIPLLLRGGYTLPITQQIGFRGYTGPTVRFNLATKYKHNGEKIENKNNKVTVNASWDFGAELVLYCFNIGFSYQLGLNKTEYEFSSSPSGIWNVYLGIMF